MQMSLAGPGLSQGGFALSLRDLEVRLPVDHSRRSLALHNRLDAVCNDEGREYHRHAGTGAQSGYRLAIKLYLSGKAAQNCSTRKE